MYSNSNSFLGANGLQPGTQQYGGGMSSGPGPPQQSALGPQPTGFGQPAPQQQYTGYLGAQMPPQGSGLLSAQYTGFHSQPAQQQSFQTGAPPLPSIPQQFQQQQHQQQHQQQSIPAPTMSSAPMKPQPTGFTEMAASFNTGAASKGMERRVEKAANKIPNIRLSFITAQDQAKFETLFKSAVGDGQTTMSGEKARDLLLRSRLDGEYLSHIWTLADTTRAGQLHFPEFALAMYLCNLKLNGKSLPSSLPENVKNEVSSMVDIINFNVADEGSNTGSGAAASTSEFSLRQNTSTPPTIQHPQPQSSNSQLLHSQMTGFPSAHQTFIGQAQGMQPQPTGFLGAGGLQNPQPTGYAGPRPPMPPMPTGYNSGMSGAPMAPLNSQPTGRPGQWGLINTPATGLPNIDALQARMMPQQGREQQAYTTTGLQGNAVIPWAITKDEKTRYDALFRAWDGMNKGYIAGSQAIEIFGQSGLEKPELERVWTLADHGNKGRLDLDEFAVAMHLIYRKLNGYPLPNSLPPELVPPSTRNFNASIGTLKSMLHQESDLRKNSGAALLPQKTGVSYLKSHTFRGSAGTPGAGRKDGTIFKNDDDAVGYRSSARRRLGNDSPRPDSPSSATSNEDLTLDQLRKKIKERQILLDAVDFKDEKNLEEDDVLDRGDRREADELYRRLRRIQEEIDAHPDTPLNSGDSDAERRALKRQLQTETDRIPDLASQVRKAEKAISDARLELFRLRDAKAHPGSSSVIVGTGPGGTVKESDRLKARAKAMMQQRTAALTGKKVDSGSTDQGHQQRLEEEQSKIRTEKENNERMVRDVEESVREFARGIEDGLQDGGKTETSEHERRRWEDALGVEDEVKEFIFELQRSSRASRVRSQDRGTGRGETPALETSPAPQRQSGPSPPISRPPVTGGGSYSSYKTPEERAAFIKQQAEQRMAERLAALGIKAPAKAGETAGQRTERERAERTSRLRQAEEEDARRDVDRQARLAEDQGPPIPSTSTATKTEPKPPPPPPSRKSGVDSGKASDLQATANTQEEDVARDLARESEAAGARLKALEEQVRQGKLRKDEEKRKKKAAVAEAKEKDAKLAAQRAEVEAARRREEELHRQLEAMNEDSASSDDDDDDGPSQITPQASTPTLGSSQVGSQELERKHTPPPVASVASAPLGEAKTESRNPYFRMLSQSSEASTTSSPSANVVPEITTSAPAGPPPAPASATPTIPAAETSTNPFHRTTARQPAAPVSRRRPDEDDGWGSDKDEEDDDSDDERPGGTSAAQLASILFGTMGPPRPLSATGDKSGAPSLSPAVSPTVSTPVASAVAPAVQPDASPPPGPVSETQLPSPGPDRRAVAAPPSPPPPPPMPSSSAIAAPSPPAPPPPAPPAPGMAPPPPPPPAPGMAPPPPPPPPTQAAPSASTSGRPTGFLGQIQAGKALKKTATRDKSGAAVSGRVLG